MIRQIASVFATLVGLFLANFAHADEVACSQSELATAQAALATAKQMMNRSIQSLQNVDGTVVDVFSTWFGAASADRTDRIKNNLISSVAFADGVTFRCNNASDPDGPAYAYTRPDQPFVIVLSEVEFFAAPDSGFNAKGGILVHEMTHFYLTAGTGDVENRYGVDGAKKLAKENPDLALKTADNHEYFVEAVFFGL
jgi:peptidyl-Lys metalloendopeptidase